MEDEEDTDKEGMCSGTGLDGILWSIQELLLLIMVSETNMLVSLGWWVGNMRLWTKSLCLMK